MSSSLFLQLSPNKVSLIITAPVITDQTKVLGNKCQLTNHLLTFRSEVAEAANVDYTHWHFKVKLTTILMWLSLDFISVTKGEILTVVLHRHIFTMLWSCYWVTLHMFIMCCYFSHILYVYINGDCQVILLKLLHMVKMWLKWHKP